jgi:hypothetical protein
VVFTLPIIVVVLGAVLAIDIVRPMTDVRPVRIAAFYRPLAEGPSPSELVPQLGIAILTRTDEAYRDALREAQFEGPILQYLLLNQTSGPPALTDASSPCRPYPTYPNNPSGIAGDFCTALHGDEQNFLHNGRGERLYSTQSWTTDGQTIRVYLYLMNPAASSWRAYVAHRARAEIEALGYSGIFLDNVDLSLYRGRQQQANSDGIVAEYAADGQYREAVAGLLGAVRKEVGPRPVWANLTNGNDLPTDWDAYLAHLDGIMHEAFVAGWDGDLADPERWETQVQQAEAALDRGKGLVTVSQGPRDDAARMRFALATYLLVAQDRASFRYADGSGGEDTSPDYFKLWDYAEYTLALGPPVGNRHRDGGVWRRDFGCGTVTVDVERQRGTITQTPWCTPYFRTRLSGLIGSRN